MVYVLTNCEQNQDGTSWSCSQAVSKYVWHTPLWCLQWKTPDDGQRNCPKHVEVYSKNKFEKLLYLVGFIIRIYSEQVQHYIALLSLTLVSKVTIGPTCCLCHSDTWPSDGSTSNSRLDWVRENREPKKQGAHKTGSTQNRESTKQGAQKTGSPQNRESTKQGAHKTGSPQKGSPQNREPKKQGAHKTGSPQNGEPTKRALYISFCFLL